MNLLVYAGKVILCSAILLGYYQLFLRNKKFHHYNRFYVLGAAALPVMLPLLRIPVWHSGGAGSSEWLQSLQAVSISSWEAAFVVTARAGTAPFLNWQNMIWIVYASGFVISSIPVLRAWLYIKKLSRMYKKEMLDDITFYNTREPGTPFSFFRSLYWNSQIPLSSESGQSVLQHELFHIRAKHSRDMLFMQALTNLFWFNPFFHILLKELQTVHEFLADEGAGSAISKYDYAELLVTQAIRHKRIAGSHQFFHHQIKRRISMIIQQPSRSSYLSRIMSLPVLFALFFQISCTRNNDSSSPNNSQLENGKPASAKSLMPAQEFMSAVENHWNDKEKSVAFHADTLLNLLTAKFENGETIMTRLSDWKTLKPKQPGDQSGSNEPVFTKVEIEASYPGGVQAYMRFLSKAFRYPMEAQQKEIQGTVIVQFMVDKDGNVSDIQALSGPEGGLKEEAVRVIGASGKWEPAVQNGHPVSSYKKQPVIFRLDVAQS